MHTTIFYYTGTGNTLWAARKVAEKLGDTQLISIPETQDISLESKPDAVGLAFPVYIWGVPAPIIRFLPKIKALNPEYLFALAINGGQVANTLVQLKKLLKKENLELNAGFSLTFPSNYIPWGGPGPQEKQQEKFQLAQEKISQIAPNIKNKKQLPVEKGLLWQRAVFTPLYHLAFPQMPNFDKSFWVDDQCNHCEICARVCPAKNIQIQDGKPVWQHQCEQCFACLQWCPQEAIQYGQKTPDYERYHHPEVKLKDVLKVW